MVGGGNISRSLCALKHVFDMIRLYLEKSKRDFTSLCFGMENPKTLGWWGYLHISHIMGKAIRTGAGKHEVSVSIKRRQALLKSDKR